MATKKKASTKSYKIPASIQKALKTLPKESAQTPPGLPVDTAVNEAVVLSRHAIRNRQALKRVMDDPSLIDAIAPRAAHLRVMQDRWLGTRSDTKGVDHAKRKRAEFVREELFHTARYVLRKDAAVQRRLDEISAGDGVVDLVADLFALAALVADHPALAAKAKVAKMKKVADETHALAESLEATITDERDDSPAWPALEERNQAAELLAVAVDEVRAAGRFALRDSAKEKTNFQSSYIRKKVARHRQLKAANAPTVVG